MKKRKLYSTHFMFAFAVILGIIFSYHSIMNTKKAVDAFAQQERERVSREAIERLDRLQELSEKYRTGYDMSQPDQLLTEGK